MLTRALALGAAAALAVTAAPAVAQSPSDDARFAAAQQRFDAELRRFQQEFDLYRSRGGPRASAYPPARYDQNAPRLSDPRYDEDGYYEDENYDAAAYYRGGSQYRERVLANDDRVYRGNDGRYYCRRNDGTTGLIVGGAAGGILGNVIDGGRSRVVGTLLGGAAGALAGRAVDRNQQEIRCR